MRRTYRSMGLGVLTVMMMLSVGVAAAQPASPHLMVGEWDVNTDGVSIGEPAREGIYTFAADGTILVVFQARPNGTGTAESLWWGEGRWAPDGDHAIRYFLSWPTKDAGGAVTGSITFDGMLVIQADDESFAEDQGQSMATVRDRNGILVATYGANPAEQTAAFTGTRLVIG